MLLSNASVDTVRCRPHPETIVVQRDDMRQELHGTSFIAAFFRIFPFSASNRCILGIDAAGNDMAVPI
jgi:hypothetical protein